MKKDHGRWNALRISSLCVSVFCTIISILAYVLGMVLCIEDGGEEMIGLFVPLISIATLTTVGVVLSLVFDKRLLFLGILEIIFSGVAGGILYIVWFLLPCDDDKTEKKNASEPSQGDSCKITTPEASLMLRETLKLYKDGMITKDQYAEITEKYIEML